MLTALLGFLSVGATVIWMLCFVPFRLIGIKLHKITDRPILAIVSKKILNKVAVVKDTDNPLGFFFHWTYIGYIHESSTGSRSSDIIYLLTTASIYKKITSGDTAQCHEGVINNSVSYKIYTRRGPFCWLDYSNRIVNTEIKAHESQTIILDRIKMIREQSLHNTCVIYLHGSPGGGKSTIPILLAIDIKADLCKTFNPTDPGDTLDIIYNKVMPTKTSPLIIVLEEVDILINKLVDGSIKSHKSIAILMQNKTQWNTFFDDLKMLYPNLILILTSNKSPEDIDKIDKSYLRSGRIDDKILIL
jgi:hypothetical protein